MSENCYMNIILLQKFFFVEGRWLIVVNGHSFLDHGHVGGRSKLIILNLYKHSLCSRMCIENFFQLEIFSDGYAYPKFIPSEVFSHQN